jgi:hypothetical protein
MLSPWFPIMQAIANADAPYSNSQSMMSKSIHKQKEEGHQRTRKGDPRI